MAFIIDTYNRFSQWDRTHSVYVFNINGNTYAIKEVEMVWGQPALEPHIDREDNASSYHIYETYEEAFTFARTLKHLNT